MRRGLVLSLFPGFGLLDRAFEEAGFAVVRGPDALWGGDVRGFHVASGVFDGVIGGPPCQSFSSARQVRGAHAPRRPALDLIPEFVRLVGEASPRFVVMENVFGARRSGAIPPHWHVTRVRDWDCGGYTHRRRLFWTWPFVVEPPPRREGVPSRSVMASTGKRGACQTVGERGYLRGDLPIAEYGRLQGFPELGEALAEKGCSRLFATLLLGNGVPRAMGRHVAEAAARWWDEAVCTAAGGFGARSG